MKVLIPAAGYATRLYPLTKDKPKHLLPIRDKPMINFILESLQEIENITDVYVVTNDLFLKNFEEWKETLNYDFNVEIVSNDSDKLRGSLGDIEYGIRKKEIDEDLMIIAGDNLFDFSLKKFYDYFLKKKSSVLALYDYRDKGLIAGRLGCAEINHEKRIVSFEEKPTIPKSTLAATACYIYTKEDLRKLYEVIDKQNCGNFIKYLVDNSVVYGYLFDGRWFDIGTLDQYGYLKNNF